MIVDKTRQDKTRQDKTPLFQGSKTVKPTKTYNIKNRED